MSFKSVLSDLFGGVGKLVMKAFNFAVDAGLKDEVVALALKWVRVAANEANKGLDNNQRREMVVKALTDHGISEGIARLATELAVRLLKAELAKV